MRAALKNLEELERYDPQFAEAVQQLKSARALVDDVSTTVHEGASRIQASPDRLAELEDRLEVLNRLKRICRPHLAQVLAHGQEVAAKLAEVENRDQLLLEATRRANQGSGCLPSGGCGNDEGARRRGPQTGEVGRSAHQ